MGHGPESKPHNNEFDPQKPHSQSVVRRMITPDGRRVVRAAKSFSLAPDDDQIAAQFIIAEAPEYTNDGSNPRAKKLVYHVQLETWLRGNTSLHDTPNQDNGITTIRETLILGTEALPSVAIKQGLKKVEERENLRREQEEFKEIIPEDPCDVRQDLWDAHVDKLAAKYQKEYPDHDEASAYREAEIKVMRLVSDLTDKKIFDPQQMGEAYFLAEVESKEELLWKMNSYAAEYPDIDMTDMFNTLLRQIQGPLDIQDAPDQTHADPDALGGISISIDDQPSSDQTFWPGQGKSLPEESSLYSRDVEDRDHDDRDGR